MSSSNDVTEKMNGMNIDKGKEINACSNSAETSIQNEQPWNIRESEFAKNTIHQVRRILERLKHSANPNKQLIPLSIGDPTVLSDLEKPDIVKEILLKCVDDKKFDNYTSSYGSDEARKAVAKFYSRPPKVEYKLNDIMLGHGCTHALDLIITVLANRGQNILIPKPGFSVYRTLSNTFGIQQKYYNLIPEKNWSVDFESMNSQIDKNTVAIVVNNPSNPTGSMFTKEDLIGIINVAKKFRIPIIADEVYGDIVLNGEKFYYMSELSDTVPIISCNAISKRFNMPGWRFGWLAIHDPKNYLAEIREGLFNLSTRLYAPNSITQGLVCELLEKTPDSYLKQTLEILKTNAELLFEKLSQLPGLIVRKPTASIYMMIGIDFRCFPDIKDDTDFVVKLVEEQSVFLIPCSGFGYPGYLRIVITVKKEKLIEACERIADFVRDHYVEPSNHI